MNLIQFKTLKIVILLSIIVFLLGCQEIEKNKLNIDEIQKRDILLKSTNLETLLNDYDTLELKINRPYFLDNQNILRKYTGGFIVFNQQSLEILVFDTLGKHINTIGSSGDGPGEFRSIICGDVSYDDNIYTLDIFKKDITIFEINGHVSNIINIDGLNNIRHMVVDDDKKIYLHHAPFGNMASFISIYDSSGFLKNLIDQVEGYELFYDRGFLDGDLICDQNGNIFETSIYSNQINKIKNDSLILFSNYEFDLPILKKVDKGNYGKLIEYYNESVRFLNLFSINNFICRESLIIEKNIAVRHLSFYSKRGIFLARIKMPKSRNFRFSYGDDLFSLYDPSYLDENKNPFITITKFKYE